MVRPGPGLAPAKVAKIECSPELYVRICTTLQHAITGKPVFYSDSLVDLVRRHCSEIHDIAAEEGCEVVASNDSRLLTHEPIDIRFDILKVARN
jgi:hypothetical protein